MKHNAAIVSSSPPIPVNFLKVWDKLYPDSRSVSMDKQLLSEIGIIKNRNCKCDEIGYLAWNNDNYNFKFNLDKGLGNYWDFGYGVEHFVSPNDCFNFWVNNDILWKGKYLKRLDELSDELFKVEVTELPENQIIELIVYRQLGARALLDTSRFKREVQSMKERFSRP